MLFRSINRKLAARWLNSVSACPAPDDSGFDFWRPRHRILAAWRGSLRVTLCDPRRLDTVIYRVRGRFIRAGSVNNRIVNYVKDLSGYDLSFRDNHIKRSVMRFVWNLVNFLN